MGLLTSHRVQPATGYDVVSFLLATRPVELTAVMKDRIDRSMDYKASGLLQVKRKK